MKKLGVTSQRLYQRTSKMKEEHGPMTTEEAAYVIAHQAGLDVGKYLDVDMTRRVRELVPRQAMPTTKAATGGRQNGTRSASIRIGADAQSVDALLSTTMAKDAQLMTQLYAKYYVLENSLRCVIGRILKHAHGAEWWDACAPTDVKNTVTDRKQQEKKKPWHGKRGQHEIYYSDFGDLRRLMEKNWSDFKDFFPSRPWITQRLCELETPRNIHAHHNPVGSRDQKRIDIYFQDWLDLLRSKMAELP